LIFFGKEGVAERRAGSAPLRHERAVRKNEMAHAFAPSFLPKALSHDGAKLFAP
jgi:hypothetical protein